MFLHAGIIICFSCYLTAALLSFIFFAFSNHLPSHPAAFIVRVTKRDALNRYCIKGTNYRNIQPTSILSIWLLSTYPYILQSFSLLSINLLSSCHHCVFPTTLCFSSTYLFISTYLSVFLWTCESGSRTWCHWKPDSSEACIKAWDPSAYEHESNTWLMIDSSIAHANPQNHLNAHSQNCVSTHKYCTHALF